VKSRQPGLVAERLTSGALHTPTFRADDTDIPVGIRVMTNLVLELLRGEPHPDPSPDRQEG